jgi:histidinol phosphatase-like enzyme (inositol monophosphatase family)
MPAALDLVALEDLLVALARAAGEAALPFFRGEFLQEDKGKGGRFDPVTEADRKAEAAVRRLLAEHRPDDGIVGEEYGAAGEDSDLVWVIDPIDGTRAFISGLPLWCTLIALRKEGRPVLGVISQPYLDEIYVGGPSGSRLIRASGERRLEVRPCPRLTDAVISTTDTNLFDGAEAGAFEQVRAAAKLARYGCDAYAYAMVALGRMDLVIEANLKAWDWQALAPVVEGAGGVVTNWRGEAPDGSGQIAAAGDRVCLDEALVALRRSAKSPIR